MEQSLSAPIISAALTAVMLHHNISALEACRLLIQTARRPIEMQSVLIADQGWGYLDLGDALSLVPERINRSLPDSNLERVYDYHMRRGTHICDYDDNYLRTLETAAQENPSVAPLYASASLDKGIFLLSQNMIPEGMAYLQHFQRTHQEYNLTSHIPFPIERANELKPKTLMAFLDNPRIERAPLQFALSFLYGTLGKKEDAMPYKIKYYNKADFTLYTDPSLVIEFVTCIVRSIFDVLELLESIRESKDVIDHVPFEDLPRGGRNSFRAIEVYEIAKTLDSTFSGDSSDTTAPFKIGLRKTELLLQMAPTSELEACEDQEELLPYFNKYKRLFGL